MVTVEAQYEDGVLRPVKPLNLRPGERVHLVIQRRPDPARWDAARLGAASSDDEAALAAAGLSDWARALDDESSR